MDIQLDDAQKKALESFLERDDVKSFVDSATKAPTADSGSFTGMVISTEHTDREGDVLQQEGMDLSAYKKNPVVLNSHNYRGIENITGITTKIYRSVSKGKPATLADGIFAPNEAGQMARMLYEQKFLNAGSVGFLPKEWKDQQNGDGSITRIFTKSELLEWSWVPVPANGQATAQRLVSLGMSMDALVEKGFAVADAEKKDIEADDKGVIPYADHGTVQNLGAEWNGSAQMTAEPAMLKDICAWYDSSAPEAKTSYKLPHHQASDKKAVWRGVSAAMAVLLGAREGADIPEADRKGVYDHLVKHYLQFDKKAPDFKLVEAQVLKDIDIEIDREIVVNILQVDDDRIKTLAADIAREQIRVALADNGDKGQKATKVDELLRHPDFHRGVLKAVDKALGISLRDMNKAGV